MGSRNKEQVPGQCVRSSEERGRGEGSGSGAPSLLTTLMSVWKLLSGCLCVGVGASSSRLQGSKGAEAKCEIGPYHYSYGRCCSRGGPHQGFCCTAVSVEGL